MDQQTGVSFPLLPFAGSSRTPTARRRVSRSSESQMRSNGTPLSVLRGLPRYYLRSGNQGHLPARPARFRFRFVAGISYQFIQCHPAARVCVPSPSSVNRKKMPRAMVCWSKVRRLWYTVYAVWAIAPRTPPVQRNFPVSSCDHGAVFQVSSRACERSGSAPVPHRHPQDQIDQPPFKFPVSQPGGFFNRTLQLFCAHRADIFWLSCSSMRSCG